MIIHCNCTRQFLVALIFADLPSLSPFIDFILVPLIFLLVVECQGAPTLHTHAQKREYIALHAH